MHYLGDLSTVVYRNSILMYDHEALLEEKRVRSLYNPLNSGTPIWDGRLDHVSCKVGQNLQPGHNVTNLYV
jgi:hypothetical protein